MLARTPSRENAIAVHEAGYAVQAHALSVTLRPPELKRLRRYFAAVIDFDTDDGSAEFCTRAATIMYAGDAALELLAPDARGDTRDLMEAGDVLYLGFRRRGAGNLHVPSIYRELHLTKARLQFEAAVFVREHQADILRTANNLTAKA
jgi:hypothetical protein